MRPKLVAEFGPPDAEARFREWETANAKRLSGIPGDAWRVEYGRTGVGAYVRVRVEEAHLPDGLTSR
jgi:hypothetical protein